MYARLMLLLTLLLAAVAHANVGFGPAPEVTGKPGDYVTFAVPVHGNGDVTVSLEAPAGWPLVSDSRMLTLSGPMQVPFTLRIPPAALLGTTAELFATATTAAGEVTTSTINVTVTGSTGTGLAETSELLAAPGQELVFKVTITNEANQPDTIVLSASNPSRQVHVIPERLELGPFQSGEVTVTVPVQGTTSDGYRFRIDLSAWSRVADTTTVRTVYATYTSGSSFIPLTERDPQLTLSITTAANAGFESSDGETSPVFNWSVTPGLSGELSDFVDLRVRTGAFRNTRESAFTVPRNTSIALSGETWDANLDLAPGSIGLGGSLQAADWRFSVGGNFMRFPDANFFGLNATASSLNPELDLQFSGILFLMDGMHNETVSVLYRRQMTEALGLGVGVGLTGSSSADGFRLHATLSQSLNWMSQSFSLTQSVSTTPSLGLTNISLLGGTRSANPIGVRFMSRFSFTPRVSRMTNSVQLSSQPVPALRLSTGIVHQTTNFGDGPGLLRLQFGVSWRFSSRTSVQFAAETFRALDESTQSGNRFRVGFATSLNRFTLGIGFSGEWRTASLTEAASRSLTLDSRAAFRFGEGSELEARLDLERSERSGYRFAVRWQHRWSHQFDSDVTVGFSHLGQDFALGVAARDVFTTGLRLGLGYGLQLQRGTITHRLTAGISYTWHIPFTTPRPVVNLFGGRETGSISGIAFSDGNRNQVLEAGEAPLAGILIQSGNYSAVTAEDGSFTLRLPAGHHALRFGGNLPATLGFIGTDQVEIQLGQNQSLNLPFAPVSVMQLSVFLDGDRDGNRDASEPLIPGTAVLLEGPMSRRVFTSQDGNVWISGLIEGTYQVTVDFASLPAGFEMTRQLEPVQVTPPANAGPLLIAVAPRVRDVVTTFTASSMAVVAHVSQASTQAGREIEIMATVNGNAEAVTAELFGQLISLEYDGSMWRAAVTAPDSPGMNRGFIEAVNGADSARADVQVFVTAPK